MKKWLLGMVCLLVLSAGASAGEFLDQVMPYVENHIEVGTRTTVHHLTDSKQDYIGSIYDMEVDQNYLPLRLFVDYYFCPYVGVGWTHDSMDFETVTKGAPGESDSTDGTFEMSQNTFSVIGRYPNDSRYTPYGGFGCTIVSSDFEGTSGWSGKGGGGQWFDCDDSMSFALHAGCDIVVQKGWSVDTYLRYIPVETEVTYYLQKGREERGPYDLEFHHLTFGLGARYSF